MSVNVYIIKKQEEMLKMFSYFEFQQCQYYGNLLLAPCIQYFPIITIINNNNNAMKLSCHLSRQVE